MRRERLLEIDAAVNLGLGAVLIALPRHLLRGLGLPPVGRPFYPRVLGGVITGIGIALLAERLSDSKKLRGLGLAGAVSINLAGAAALTELLLREDIEAPLRGRLLLWLLDATLVGLSATELAELVE